MFKKIIKLVLVSCLFVVGGCSANSASETGTKTAKKTEKKKKQKKTLTEEEQLEQRLNDWISSHSLEEQVAQLFVIRPESLTGVDTVTQASDVTKNALSQYPVGGIIYFSKNIETPDQTSQMLTNTKQYCQELGIETPFLTVDEEGGLVSRIANNENFNVETFSSMWDIGQTQDTNQAANVGNVIGSYLKELGFNMDMAPDADVLSNSENEVIGTRSFSSDPNVESEMVQAEVSALKAQGIIPVIKHFPGHGGTLGDTHEGYAYTDKTLDELMADELIPFKNAIDNGIDVIMAAHISVPNVIGDNTPTTLSSYMITDVLRGQLGYDGLVITDGMEMGAIVNSYDSATAAVMAIQAGCDMILMPEDFVSAYNGIIDAVNNGTLSNDRIAQSVKRILKVKWKYLS